MRSRRAILAGGWLALAVAPLALVPLGATADANATPAASGQHIGTFATTVIAGGLTSAGDVGASGGLVSVDSGSAYIRGRLDSGPSSSMLAAPVEPGTLARSVVGVANCPNPGPPLPNCLPPMLLLHVPDAEAQYPGHGAADLNTTPTTVGPLTVGDGSASARTTAATASGTTTAAATTVAGVYDAAGSTSDAELARDGDNLAVSSTSGVSAITVAGVLKLTDVVGFATISVVNGVRTPKAGVTIGSASVNGTNVTIDDTGVHAGGQTIPALPVPQDSVNQALAAAGIQVHTLGALSHATSTGVSADSGGVVITITTRSVAATGANTMTLYVGRVVETESDGPAAPPAELIPPSFPDSSTLATADIPGVEGVPGTPGSSRHHAAAAARFLVVGGLPLTLTQALIAFALWQVLSLSPPTLTTLVRRRRRARLEEA